MAWKYIITQVRVGGTVKEIPMLFPEDVVHLFAAEAMERICVAHGWRPGEVVAAGECTLEVSSAGGKSTSIKPTVYAREGDAQWLTMYPYHHGYVSPRQP